MDAAIRFSTEVSLDINPRSMDGVILHFGQSRDARHQDFFTVMLRNGSLVLSFSLGGPTGGQANALTLRICCVKMNEWQRLEAGRSGREGYLTFHGKTEKGVAPPGLTTLDVDSLVHLGNILKQPLI